MQYQPSPGEEAWYGRMKEMGAMSTPKFKGTKKPVPPEPDGFRRWLKLRYPLCDVSIAWLSLVQFYPEIVKEFRSWTGGRITPSAPTAAPLTEWRKSQ